MSKNNAKKDTPASTPETQAVDTLVHPETGLTVVLDAADIEPAPKKLYGKAALKALIKAEQTMTKTVDEHGKKVEIAASFFAANYEGLRYVGSTKQAVLDKLVAVYEATNPTRQSTKDILPAEAALRCKRAKLGLLAMLDEPSLAESKHTFESIIDAIDVALAALPAPKWHADKVVVSKEDEGE